MDRPPLSRNARIALAVVAALVSIASLTWALRFVLPNAGGDPATAIAPSTPAPDAIQALADQSTEDDEPRDEDESNECSLRPPGPLLDDSAYPDYKVTKSSTSVEENARLAGGIDLKVTTTGCEDFASAEFELHAPSKLLKGRATLERLKWLRTQLSTVAYKSGDYYSEKADFLINNFSKLKTDTKGPQTWSICNDESIPGPAACTDPADPGPCLHECGWDNGGATEFESRDDKGKAILVFRHFFSA